MSVTREEIDHFNGPVILLFGMQGTGRSSFVNKVMGSGILPLEEVTTTCAFIDQIPSTGLRAAFVLTPSFDTTSAERSEYAIMHDISSWITKHLGTRLKITAALYFQSIAKEIDDGKSTRDIRLFHQIVGSSCKDIVRIASMDWHLVGKEAGEKIEASHKWHGWKRVWMCNVPIYRLRDDDDSCLDMVREVLKIEAVFIAAQKFPGDSFAPLLGPTRIVRHRVTPYRVKLSKDIIGLKYMFLFLALGQIVSQFSTGQRRGRKLLPVEPNPGRPFQNLRTRESQTWFSEQLH